MQGQNGNLNGKQIASLSSFLSKTWTANLQINGHFLLCENRHSEFLPAIFVQIVNFRLKSGQKNEVWLFDRSNCFSENFTH